MLLRIILTLAMSLTLHAGLGISETSQPSPKFSHKFLPQHGQRMRVLNETLAFTPKIYRANVDVTQGFYGYHPPYFPDFYYLPQSQKITIPSYVVAIALAPKQQEDGVLYIFEGHDVFDEMDKFGRIEVFVNKSGTCQLTWTLRNTLRAELYSKATGGVSYDCTTQVEKLSHNR